MRTPETGKRLQFLSILFASMTVVIQIWKKICFINVEDWRIKKIGFSSLLYLHWWKFYFKNIFENKLFEKCPCLELFWSHFPAFGLNTKRYFVSLRIQSKCGKMRTRITPNTHTFYAVVDGPWEPQGWKSTFQMPILFALIKINTQNDILG